MKLNLEGYGEIHEAIHKAFVPELFDACKKFPIDNKIKTLCQTGEC